MSRAVHIAIMVPINNTTFEQEVLGWLPQDSKVTVLKIPRGPGLLNPETLPAYKSQALELAEKLRGTDVDVVAYGCTAAGFILGPQGDLDLRGELEAIVGKPVITTAGAMVECLNSNGVNDIALITPYLEDVNTQLKNFLSNGGIRISRFDSFYAKGVHDLGNITSQQVAKKARDIFDDKCGGLFIACAQLPTQSILEELRNEFKVPVFSSNYSTTIFAQKLLESKTNNFG